MSHARALLASILRRELGPPYSNYDAIPLPRREIARLRAHYPHAMAHVLELAQRSAGSEPQTTTPRRERAKTKMRT
jgi:hypothetical protein